MNQNYLLEQSKLEILLNQKELFSKIPLSNQKMNLELLLVLLTQECTDKRTIMQAKTIKKSKMNLQQKMV